MTARDLAARVERLTEGLRAAPDTDAARALADEGQQLLESVEQLQQVDCSEQDRQQRHQ